MHRRLLLLSLATIGLLATQAMAQSVAEQISRQLRDQGFGQVTISQTWLGRTRIIGKSGDGQREIILNPKTGEILRDLFTTAGGKSGSPVISGTRSGSGNSGSSDDDNDDNSGSGSGSDDDDDNAGSGGGSDDDDDNGSGDDGNDDDSGSDDDGGSDDNENEDSGGEDDDDK